MESKEADGADLASVTHGATQKGPPKKTQQSLHAFFDSTAIGTTSQKRKAARDCDAGPRAQGDKATDAEEAKAARVRCTVIQVGHTQGGNYNRRTWCIATGH